MVYNDILQEIISKLTNIKEFHFESKSNELYYKNHDVEKNIMNLGKNIFELFFKVGIQALKENVKSFKKIENTELKSLVSDVTTLIVDTEDFIYRYLLIFPRNSIQIEKGEYQAYLACKIRSGVQFMLELFDGVDNNTDDVLKYLYDEVVSDFDKRILLAKNFSNFKVPETDIPELIPKTHVWWF